MYTFLHIMVKEEDEEDGAMFVFIEKAVIAMAMLRLMSGSIELFAAFLIFKFNDLEKALIVNSSIAIVGPIIFITTTAIGLTGIADKITLQKLIWIFIGVACIIYGVKSA